MRNYIDPTTYTFSEAEWGEYAFVSRLDELIEALSNMSDMEGAVNALYKIFRFRASEDLLDEVYRLNPFINTPERPNFYQQKFRSAIFPELLRRMDY
ncbi:MAG: hypothetical protein EOP06_13490, partial [Proteobacteria bacterium]